MSTGFADWRTRTREHTEADAEHVADVDARREPAEFLREIYKEAANNQQPPDSRIAKLLAKCSALFVRLSEDQAKIAQKNIELQAKIADLTTGLHRMTIAIIAIAVVQVAIAFWISFAQ